MEELFFISARRNKNISAKEGIIEMLKNEAVRQKISYIMLSVMALYVLLPGTVYGVDFPNINESEAKSYKIRQLQDCLVGRFLRNRRAHVAFVAIPNETAPSEKSPYPIKSDTFSIRENPYKYSGYYCDSESGMYYCQARYYSPELMRFINRDTYDLSNRYAYCDGDPIGKTDPNGHSAFGWEDGVGMVAGMVFSSIPILGDVISAVAQEMTTQSIRIAEGEQEKIDGSSIAIAVAMSVGLTVLLGGGIIALGMLKAGRGGRPSLGGRGLQAPLGTQCTHHLPASPRGSPRQSFGGSLSPRPTTPGGRGTTPKKAPGNPSPTPPRPQRVVAKVSSPRASVSSSVSPTEVVVTQTQATPTVPTSAQSIVPTSSPTSPLVTAVVVTPTPTTVATVEPVALTINVLPTSVSPNPQLDALIEEMDALLRGNSFSWNEKAWDSVIDETRSFMSKKGFSGEPNTLDVIDCFLRNHGRLVQ